MQNKLDRLQKNGFLKVRILNKKNNNLIIKEIEKIFLSKNKKIALDDHVSNLYKTNPIFASRCYDLLNKSSVIKKIFLNNKIFKSIRYYFRLKLNARLSFANFQFLIMLPGTKIENLGWHQDSRYFKFSNKINSSFILWTSISSRRKKVNGTLSVFPESHKQGSIIHSQNILKFRKKAPINKRGLYFINTKKLNRLKKKKNINFTSGDTLLFDGNIVHKTGPNLKNSKDIRYTIIARYILNN